MNTKPTRRMLVDGECVELAQHFLTDVPGHTLDDVQDLAEAIQMAVEDFCSDLVDRRGKA